MDKAKKGVIYFSFGTLLKASNIRKEIAQTFLTVFGQLDQTILWKADLKHTDWDIPKNVYIRDQFDQISILGKLGFCFETSIAVYRSVFSS